MKKDVAHRFKLAVEAINHHEEMINHDDTGDLNDPDFRDTTDDKTTELLENLENLINAELVDGAGEAIQTEIRQAAQKAGIKIAFAASPYPGEEMEAAIVVTTDKGKLSVPVTVY